MVAVPLILLLALYTAFIQPLNSASKDASWLSQDFWTQPKQSDGTLSKALGFSTPFAAQEQDFGAFHPGPVNAVDFSPNGDLIASGGADGRVRLWDLQGKQIAAMEGHSGRVLSVAFSPDGKTLASGAAYDLIRLWELKPDQSYLPALWTLVAVVLAFALLAFCFWFYGKSYRRATRKLREERWSGKPVVRHAVETFLESDGPLTDPRMAGVSLNALVERLAKFLTNKNTSLLLTIALTGEWGTGKSSVMNLLRQKLLDDNNPTVWFNAWHHQSEDHLFASLMEQIRRDAMPSPWKKTFYNRENLQVRGRLIRSRLVERPLRYFLSFLLLAFLIALVVFQFANGHMEVDGSNGVRHFLETAAKPGGILVSLLIAFFTARDLLKLFKISPAELIKAEKGLFSTSRFVDKLSFRHRFAAAFQEVSRAFGNKRLTILIDDLDRCQPEHVSEVLEAINFLSSSGDCFFVLGIAETPVKYAVGLSFKDIAYERALECARTRQTTQDENSKVDISKTDEFEARQSYATDYLEKLINLRIPVPPFDTQALGEILNNNGADKLSPTEEQTKSSWRTRVLLLLSLLLPTAAMVFFAHMVQGLFMKKEEPNSKANEKPKEGDKPSDEGNLNDGTTVGGNGETGVAGPVEATPAPTDAGQNPDQLDLADPNRLDGNVAPAPESFDLLNYTAPAALAVLALALLTLLDPKIWRKVKDWARESETREDSLAFTEAMKKHLPLVLKEKQSPRAVKRFINRMRYLTGDMEQRGSGSMDKLVLLGALDELGKIDISQPTWSGALAADIRLEQLGLSLDEHSVSNEEWEAYRQLASSVRFSASPEEKGR